MSAGKLDYTGNSTGIHHTTIKLSFINAPHDVTADVALQRVLG